MSKLKKLKEKKKIISFIFAICFILPISFIVAGCGDSHQHAFGEWEIESSATCINPEIQHRICECGEKEVREVGMPLGHLEGEWMVDQNSTCTSTGIKHKECTRCEITTSTETIAKKDHDMTEWAELTPATCTETQVLEKHCTTCSTQNQTKDGIAALGHTESDWNIDQDSTCTATGTKHKECTRCEETLSRETIAKKDHDYQQSVISPTESTDGYTLQDCKNCNSSFTERESYLLTFEIVVYSSLESEGYSVPTLLTTEQIVYKDDIQENPYRFTETLQNNYYYTKDIYVTPYSGFPSLYDIGDEISIYRSTKISLNIEALKFYNSKGGGSETNPYLIYNEIQLQHLSEYCESNSIYENTYFKQMADIDLTGINWVPIAHNSGSKMILFGGVYDGNKHEISNMKIEGSYLSVGLFGTVSGIIKNLKLVSVNIGNVGYYTSATDNSYGCTIGAVVGYSTGNVENCYVSGSITTDGRGYKFALGGVVGYGHAKNCINEATINVDDLLAKAYIGGVCGTGTAINCINRSDITVTQFGTYDNYYTHIGGIICGGSTNSYMLGDINYINEDSSIAPYFKVYIGGLSTNTVSYDTSYFLGHINVSSVVDLPYAYVGVMNCYNSSSDNSICGFRYCIEYANEIEEGNIKAEIPVDDEVYNIKGLTYQQFISGDKTYFANYGEYISEEDLLENENNVWIFAEGYPPRLYYEV